MVGIGCALWGWLGSASAATLAVFPLDAGSGAESYPGLGRAFAGLIVSDLVGAPGVELVERARLDAVLAEIDLAAGGFLDPSRAAAAGRGVGAEWVLVGSYAIVDGVIAVEGRVVDVETGAIRAAASSDGAPGEFVDVEDRVVAGLLAQLDTQFGGSPPPTSVFDAFVSWGRALDAEAVGDEAGAARAWTAALDRDPGFTVARDALARLRDVREADVERTRVAAESAEAARWEYALAETADAHPSRRRRDLADLLIRWHALWRLGRHCERAASMRDLLEVSGWDTRSLPSAGPRAIGRVYALGLDRPEGYGGFPSDPAITTAVGLLADTERLVLHYDAGALGDPRSQGLVASVLRCEPASAWSATFDRLIADVDDHGLAALATDDEYRTWTFGYRLRTAAARLEADTTGLSDATAAWLAGLFDDPALGEDGRAYARMRVEQIERAARATRRHQARTAGLGEAVIVGLGRALASGDPSVVAPEAPGCAEVTRDAQVRLTRPLQALEDPVAWPGDPAHRAAVSDVALAVLPPLDLGCVRGVPARFTDVTQVVDHVLLALPRVDVDADPSCAGVEAEARRQIAAARGMATQAPDVARYDLVRWYLHGPYGAGCFGVEPRVAGPSP